VIHTSIQTPNANACRALGISGLWDATTAINSDVLDDASTIANKVSSTVARPIVSVITDDARVWQSAGPRSYLAENVTEASGDRCWNCGMVPKRWFDVTPPGLDEQRLVCANCFARTTRPLPHYGWARSRSADWDEGDDDEEQPDSDWS
jgi:hypothetical protein